MNKITDIVKGTAKFTHYRNNELWYNIEWYPTDGDVTYNATVKNFKFPVHISETGEALYPAECSAIQMLKFIKKQHDIIVKELTELAKQAIAGMDKVDKAVGDLIGRCEFQKQAEDSLALLNA